MLPRAFHSLKLPSGTLLCTGDIWWGWAEAGSRGLSLCVKKTYRGVSRIFLDGATSGGCPQDSAGATVTGRLQAVSTAAASPDATAAFSLD